MLEKKRQLSSAQKKICISIFLVFVFLFIAFINVFVSNNLLSTILMIANGCIASLFLFIFKKKKRIYFILFFVPLIKFMLPNSLGIGSMFNFVCLLYYITLLVEFLQEKKKGRNKSSLDACLFFLFFFFVYILIIQLSNFGASGFIKTFPILIQLFLPFSFSFDYKAEKKAPIMALYFALGLLASNIVPAFFCYILKDKMVSFLQIYIPTYVRSATLNSGVAFRFPGLLNDPNHNSLCILLSSAFLLLTLRDQKNKAICVLLICFLQSFAVLGSSKTYFISLIFILIVMIFTLRKKIGTFFVLLIISSLFLIGLVLCLSIPTLTKTLLRFFNIDTRVGLLEALTTGRTSIFISYFYDLSLHPVSLLFGNGVDSVSTIANMDPHNSFVQAIWSIGLTGCVCLIIYYRFIFKSLPKRLALIPCIIILFYFTSLHVLFREYFIAGLYIYSLIIDYYNDSLFKAHFNKELFYYEICV